MALSPTSMSSKGEFESFRIPFPFLSFLVLELSTLFGEEVEFFLTIRGVNVRVSSSGSILILAWKFGGWDEMKNSSSEKKSGSRVKFESPIKFWEPLSDFELLDAEESTDSFSEMKRVSILSNALASIPEVSLSTGWFGKAIWITEKQKEAKAAWIVLISDFFDKAFLIFLPAFEFPRYAWSRSIVVEDLNAFWRYEAHSSLDWKIFWWR